MDKSSEVIGTKVSTDLGVANGGQFVPDTTKYPVQESETGTGSSSNLVHPEVDRLLKVNENRLLGGKDVTKAPFVAGYASTHFGCAL